MRRIVNPVFVIPHDESYMDKSVRMRKSFGLKHLVYVDSVTTISQWDIAIHTIDQFNPLKLDPNTEETELQVMFLESLKHPVPLENYPALIGLGLLIFTDPKLCASNGISAIIH